MLSEQALSSSMLHGVSQYPCLLIPLVVTEGTQASESRGARPRRAHCVNPRAHRPHSGFRNRIKQITAKMKWMMLSKQTEHYPSRSSSREAPSTNDHQTHTKAHTRTEHIHFTAKQLRQNPCSTNAAMPIAVQVSWLLMFGVHGGMKHRTSRSPPSQAPWPAHRQGHAAPSPTQWCTIVSRHRTMRCGRVPSPLSHVPTQFVPTY